MARALLALGVAAACTACAWLPWGVPGPAPASPDTPAESVADPDRRLTTASGLRLGYSDAGRGEPALLLLPGWCASRAAFEPMIPALAQTHRVLALDWRGHGSSDPAPGEFGFPELVEDAMALVLASGAQSVVPVALSHAGWAALELRRRLGERVPRVVLLNWIVFDAPPPFLAVLSELQDRSRWENARDQLFTRWLGASNNEALARFFTTVMGAQDYPMWARAGREIAAAYRRHGNPLKAFAALEPPPPVLHLYAQPADPAFLEAQRAFAKENGWLSVQRVEAQTPFPMFEAPEEMARAIAGFAGS